MADALDSIVKGAPSASLDEHDLTKSVGGTSPIAASTAAGGLKAGDPLHHTPSSPSMIYLNLLILEASLRAQYLELRARRRHHTFFLALLTLWTVGFGWALFLAPREDGRGVGGSVYWMVESTERICFLGGIMTAILVWAVGIWERGVRWPRRWLAVSNRGLRGFNCKLVVVKRPWWRELGGTIGWFLTYGAFSNTGGSSYRYVEPAVLKEIDREMRQSGASPSGGVIHGGLLNQHHQHQHSQHHPTLPTIITDDEEKAGHEEDLAPGGDYVKLLLLPKPFSPTFRENWELYRSEYWERENERRALLRAKIKDRDRRLQRQQGGWFWWLPWRRVHVAERGGPHQHARDPEKVGAHHPLQHKQHAAVAAELKRPRSSSGGVRRGSLSTGSNSRSTTPTLESPAGGGVGGAGGSPGGGAGEDGTVSRRSSTASNPDKRRKRLGSSSARTRPRVEARSITPTPDNPTSPLAKESSVVSEAAGS